MAKKKNNNPVAPAKKPVAATGRPQPVRAAAKPTVENQSFIQKYAQVLIVAGISLLTYVCYKTILNNELTNWDDLGYLINDSLVKSTTSENIKNIFSLSFSPLAAGAPVMGNYHPLTILFYAIEYSYVGLEPMLYHMDSLLLHILVTIAVYIFVKVFTKDTIIAAFTALLFGVHPMHVESVAWAAGRKDILYGLFYVLAATAYIYYIRSTGAKKTFSYILVLVLFVLSLLSKGVAVILPISLLLIDYFEGRKLFSKVGGKLQINYWIVVEKIPHFALSYFFGKLASNTQEKIGAMTLDVHFNPFERLALGCYALCSYLWKAMVPTGMCNFYAYPLKEKDALPSVYYIYPVIVLGLAVVLWMFARRNKLIIWGVGFFLVNIVLLLQFIPVGGAIISDRYGYIPYIGIFIIIGWLASYLYQAQKSRQTAYGIMGALVAYCLVLGYLTNERSKDWHDSITLWNDDIQKNPTAPVGYFYLGQAYFTKFEAATNPNEKKAMGDSSMKAFNNSVARKPDYINPLICIAELQRNYNQIDAAKETYFRALKINDKNESIYLGLGVVYSIKKQFDSAQIAFRKALSLKTPFPEGHSNYANFLDIVGKPDSSLAEYAIAIKEDPDAFIPYMNRGRIYMRQNKIDDAIKDFNMALQKNDKSGDSYLLRSKCYLLKGNKAQARKDADQAKSLGINVDPAYLQQLN